jgi:hypothetical protein
LTIFLLLSLPVVLLALVKIYLTKESSKGKILLYDLLWIELCSAQSALALSISPVSGRREGWGNCWIENLSFNTMLHVSQFIVSASLTLHLSQCTIKMVHLSCIYHRYYKVGFNCLSLPLLIAGLRDKKSLYYSLLNHLYLIWCLAHINALWMFVE